MKGSRNQREGWFAGRYQGKCFRQMYYLPCHRGHPCRNIAESVAHGYVPRKIKL